MKSNNRNYSNENIEQNYAKAPYNFIPFPEKIVYRHTLLKKDKKEENGAEKVINELPKHDKFKNDLKTGYIDYFVEVETPLFISDGNNDFFKVNGEYVIPGSTMRGKVRSNSEILSCSYPEFIEDKRLWFREIFFNNVLKKMYRKEVLDENGNLKKQIKAGYLNRKGNKWFITPAKEDKSGKTFKEIHERKLRDAYRNIDQDIKKKMFMYRYFNKGTQEKLWDVFLKLKNQKKNISKKIEEKKKELSKNEIKLLESKKDRIDERAKNLLKNNKLKFTPYYYRVSYNLKDNNEVEIKKVVKSTKNEEYGFLMNSSNLNNKQNHYLIFKKDTDKGEKAISDKLINQYKTSVKCKQEEEVESFKIDSENQFINNKEKPIFYIIDDEGNIKSFGFTPYLKVPYKKTVREGIKTKIKNEEAIEEGKIDYAKSIFGFANLKYNDEENKETSASYKGRVSFTNAKPIEKDYKQIKEPVLKHLMNPRISSFQLYLKQSNNDPNKLKTYSDDDFELRGQKFYWLRDKHDGEDSYKKDLQEYNKIRKGKSPKLEQYATLYAVDKGAIFKGRIYFENLHTDELGLLLMSIKPFENAKENLGQGKPYGYGKVNLKIEDVVEIDSKDRFMNLNMGSSEESIKKDKDGYIQEFKDYMKTQNINVDFENESMYKCFYESKVQEKRINDDTFNYMEIKEFKNRNILKTVEDYSKESKGKDAEQYVAATEENSIDRMAKMLGSKFSVKFDKRKNRKK